MPKIEVPLKRDFQTRSKTQDSKKTENKKEGTEEKRSASKTERKEKLQRTGTKMEDRKFFTVNEDNVILNYLKDHEEKLTLSAIADNLSKKLKHTSESIRDRVRRYLQKLAPSDKEYISKEAKVKMV